MTALKTLNQLGKISSQLASRPFPADETAIQVKKQIQTLNELTFIYVLTLMVEENEQKLNEIILNLTEGTEFYDFTILAHQLSKKETDFDFLTDARNIPVYDKITEVSQECGVSLLPYVNVLRKIADNRQLGLYSENQEVSFFLEEFPKTKIPLSFPFCCNGIVQATCQ